MSIFTTLFLSTLVVICLNQMAIRRAKKEEQRQKSLVPTPVIHSAEP